MSDIRNHEVYRARVLDELGEDYTVEDLRNFERWRLKVLHGLGNSHVSEADLLKTFIHKTASGDIATITDGADDVPVKSLKVNIVPKQSGSGDPSPSNVRPISGWDEVEVVRCGKNLFEVADATGDNWLGGANGSIQRMQLTKEANGISLVIPSDPVMGFVIRKTAFKPNVTYTLGFDIQNANGRMFIRLFDANGNNISSADISISGFSYNQWFACYFKNGNQATFTIPNSCAYAWVGIGAASTTSGTRVYLSNIQLEVGSTATTYEPYQGTSYSIPLPSTVYGGTLNVTTGELTLYHKLVTFDGSSDESLAWVYNQIRATISDANINGIPSAQLKCNRLKPLDSRGGDYSSLTFSLGTYASPNDNKYLFIIGTGATSLAEGKTWLASNPVEVWYPLAEPITVQLTPTEVKTLLGSNNIYSDSGSVEVEYRADTTIAYNELAATVLENVGN